MVPGCKIKYGNLCARLAANESSIPFPGQLVLKPGNRYTVVLGLYRSWDK